MVYTEVLMYSKHASATDLSHTCGLNAPNEFNTIQMINNILCCFGALEVCSEVY
jgi:hypothetical protein